MGLISENHPGMTADIPLAEASAAACPPSSSDLDLFVATSSASIPPIVGECASAYRGLVRVGSACFIMRSVFEREGRDGETEVGGRWCLACIRCSIDIRLGLAPRLGGSRGGLMPIGSDGNRTVQSHQIACKFVPAKLYTNVNAIDGSITFNLAPISIAALDPPCTPLRVVR